MKSFLVISIILMLGFNHIGYYFVIQCAQEKVKDEMKEKIISGIDEKELSLVNYTDNQQHISWEEEEANEFSYQGEMYDVVHRSIENGKIILHCVSDKKESQLVEKYKSAVKDHDGTDKKQKKGGDQPTNLFFDAAAEVTRNNIALSTANTAFNNCNLATGIFVKNSPPPKA